MSASYNDRGKDIGTTSANPPEPQVSIDGFKQVLEMLRIADPAFRESLLKRLAARDAELARSLRRDLNL